MFYINIMWYYYFVYKTLCNTVPYKQHINKKQHPPLFEMLTEIFCCFSPIESKSFVRSCA